jgi:glycosyltransferase involved in cell wall biosynthesis
MKLSIIIPVYNEENTIIKILDKIRNVKLKVQKEIIIVDDGSTDKSNELITNYLKKNKYGDYKLVTKKNGGKGSAVKEGFRKAKGDIIIIQDADLEYDPNDYNHLIQPIIDKKFQVIYGSRRLDKSNKTHSHFRYYAGGILVTTFTNILYGSQLTDEPTCYKVFSHEVIKKLKINSNGFEWEPEITAKILKRGIKIGELPIKYYPRKVSEGKKINWKDGLKALWTLLYYKFRD